MSIDSIASQRPLWVCKLDDNKLKEYLDVLNEFELKGTTNSELILNTVKTWYDISIYNSFDIEYWLFVNIKKLADDVYKEAAARWYDAMNA